MKIDELVAEMKPKRYTRAQAALEVGRDADTLKRWKRDGVYAAHETRMFGSLSVDLYTLKDIKAMKVLASTLKPGRKPRQAA